MKCEQAGHFYEWMIKKKEKSASPQSGLQQFVVSRGRSNPGFQPSETHVQRCSHKVQDLHKRVPQTKGQEK